MLNDEESPIIIIQGDTGSAIDVDWKNPDEMMIKQRMSNLNSYYLPNMNKTLLYETITPVNTFRIIFNLYFDGNYELLEDKMYWSTGEKPYDFKDITEILMKN